MNRFQLESLRAGVAQELCAETAKLQDMYASTESTAEGRAVQKNAVADIKERLEGLNAQVHAMDEEAARKFRKNEPAGDPKAQLIADKAELYRATMQNRQPAFKAGLADAPNGTGDKFLPKTVANEILTEPTIKNPLRGLSAFTAITNLEIPRIAFSLDEDEFIKDGETAKEIAAAGSTVAFNRYKFKVFVDLSETVLLGTDTNLVAAVDSNLQSGLAKKEKKSAFATAPTEDYKHMSFYARDAAGKYEIKAADAPSGSGTYRAIRAALADLEDDYRENASVVMRFTDFLDIMEELANGSTTLYGVQPEQVLGVPVVFCDLAEIPIVGDFSYSHFNYDIGMIYDRDKNVKTGMESFVLTAWFDHQIKMKSAFRLATAVNP